MLAGMHSQSNINAKHRKEAGTPLRCNIASTCLEDEWNSKQEVSLQGKVITISANLLLAANMYAWKNIYKSIADC